ncbi:hypothetical protein Tco_1335959 [Tanacetum coccineum]
MPPTMTTRSAGRPAAASRGGGTGGRAGSGGGRTRGRSGDQGDGRIDGQGGQVGGQGSEVNDGVNGVLDFSTIIAQQLQNLLLTIVAQVGDQGRGQGNGRNQNGDAINDNIRGLFQDMSGCRNSQKVKYTAGLFVGKALTWWNSQIHTRGRETTVETELWNHAMVRAGHAAYTDRFHALARLVPHLVTPEGKRIERYVYGLALQIRGMVAATEPKTIQKAVQIAGTLTDEALRNGSIKKNPEKRGNAFAISANLVRRGTDISKITRKPSKMGKHGHEKRKSTREAKDSKPKPKKVYSQALIGSLKLEGHVAMKKAQGEVGFTLFSLTKQAQAVTSRNDSLAIRGKKIMIQGL